MCVYFFKLIILLSSRIDDYLPEAGTCLQIKKKTSHPYGTTTLVRNANLRNEITDRWWRINVFKQTPHYNITHTYGYDLNRNSPSTNVSVRVFGNRVKKNVQLKFTLRRLRAHCRKHGREPLVRIRKKTLDVSRVSLHGEFSQQRGAFGGRLTRRRETMLKYVVGPLPKRHIKRRRNEGKPLYGSAERPEHSAGSRYCGCTRAWTNWSAVPCRAVRTGSCPHRRSPLPRESTGDWNPSRPRAHSAAAAAAAHASARSPYLYTRFTDNTPARARLRFSHGVFRTRKRTTRGLVTIIVFS